MHALIALAVAVALSVIWLPSKPAQKPGLKVGVAAFRITPSGPNPDWDGTITQSGVWGEQFTDANGNGRWDAGEPFEDDSGNTRSTKVRAANTTAYTWQALAKIELQLPRTTTCGQERLR